MNRLLPGIAAALFAAIPVAVAQTPAGDIVTLDVTGPRPIAMLAIAGGEPVPVIFDTGASGNVIDADYARQMGLPEEGLARVGTPAGGPPMEGFRTSIAEATLGGAAIRNVRAAALPMPAGRSLAVKGVFGPGTFAGRLVHLDLARGQIRLTDRSAAAIPAGTAYPYSGAGPRSLPGVPIEIAGQMHDGHIDTGQPGMLMLPMALAGQVPLDGALVAGPPARMADGVPRNVMIGRIRGTIRVGPLTFENPEVRFMDGLQRVNVGVAALRGVVIVLDPEERRSWLVPSP